MNDTTKLPFHIDIARQLAFSNIGLILLSLTYFLLLGFDKEEFTILFSILGPCTGLYLGIAFQVMGEIKIRPDIKIPHEKTIKRMIRIPFFIMGILISIKAFAPARLDFSELVFLLGIIETTISIPLGGLIKQLLDPQTD